VKHHEPFVIRIIAHTSDQNSNVNVSIMYLASLNVDILLHLIKFVNPVDRFNLVLSGILKGFENVCKGMDIKKRYFNHDLFFCNK
jgi:hypothetical protein